MSAALVVVVLLAVLLTRGSPDPAQGTPASLGPVVKDREAFAALAVPLTGAAAPLPNETPITPPDHFDEAAAEPLPGPRSLRRFGNVAPSGGTWAVLIGINDYPGSRHDLRSAVSDVADMAQALAAMGVGAERRLVLTDRQASAENIRRSIDWLNAHAGPDSVAVFFYAGHVVTNGADTQSIVASDTRHVTDADLAGRLRGLQAKRAWIAIAACYGGGFTEALAPGRVLTGAAPQTQLAYENSSFGRSYMVEFMVRQAMLENRAGATVQTAFEYARSSISRQYPGREPVQVDHGAGPLDLRPPGAPRPPASSAPASPPPPPPQHQPSGTTTTTAPPAEKKCGGVPNPLVRCN